MIDDSHNKRWYYNCVLLLCGRGSDLCQLQYRDVFLKEHEALLHFRVPKETQVKSVSFLVKLRSKTSVQSIISNCLSQAPVTSYSLPVDYTLFLTYLDSDKESTSICTATAANWIKINMDQAGIDTSEYSAHSIRSAQAQKQFNSPIQFSLSKLMQIGVPIATPLKNFIINNHRQKQLSGLQSTIQFFCGKQYHS